MTYEDALEYAEYVKDRICYQTSCWPQEDCPECALNKWISIVKEAVEKQNKYRWHDLRKNPQDLPTSNMNVYIAYKWQESGKISYYLESFVEGEFLSPSDAEVIAWKYIEPVEEDVSK